MWNTVFVPMYLYFRPNDSGIDLHFPRSGLTGADRVGHFILTHQIFVCQLLRCWRCSAVCTSIRVPLSLVSITQQTFPLDTSASHPSRLALSATTRGGAVVRASCIVPRGFLVTSSAARLSLATQPHRLATDLSADLAGGRATP